MPAFVRGHRSRLNGFCVPYSWRRGRQGNDPGAEEDLTAAIARGWDDAGVYQSRAHAHIRLNRVEQARRDCEQAEKRAPNDPITYSKWGDLHLALGKYDEAIVQYQSALKAESAAVRHFELGLALLLANRFGEAKAAYDKGLQEGSATDIKMALSELDFWTSRQAERVASTEARATIVSIRQRLAGRLSEA